MGLHSECLLGVMFARQPSDWRCLGFYHIPFVFIFVLVDMVVLVLSYLAGVRRLCRQPA